MAPVIAIGAAFAGAGLVGGLMDGSSKRVGGRYSSINNEKTTTNEIAAQQTQLASDENQKVQQQDLQNEVIANNQKAKTYEDNPRKLIASILSNNNANNQNM